MLFVSRLLLLARLRRARHLRARLRILLGLIKRFYVDGILAVAGRDEAADDDVFLQAAQLVDLGFDGGFDEHAGRILERCGGQE